MDKNFEFNTVKQNTRRFRSLNDLKLLEELPDTKPLVVVDINGFIIYCNSSFELNFNLCEGNSFHSVSSEPNISIVIENLKKSRYSNFHFEYFFFDEKTSSTEIYLVDLERVLIGDAEYFVLVFSSMESKYRLEEKINNLHDALEYGSVPVIITDEEGCITYTTKSFEQILSMEIEQLYKQPLPEVLSCFVTVTEKENLKKALIENSRWESLITSVNSEQEPWFKELKLAPVIKQNNTKTNYILTAHDITNYVLKNKIIKESEERQKSIINNISDLLLILKTNNSKLHFENANDNFYETFSLERNSCVNKEIDEFLDESLTTSIYERLNTLTNSKCCLSFEYEFKPTKRVFSGKITFVPGSKENELIIIASLKDISELVKKEIELRKAYREAEIMSRLKTAFLANMSHELRTPLTAIMGFIYIIGEELNENNYESLHELFPSLKEGAERLLNMVNDVTEVSLIESGEIELEIARRFPNKIIQNIWDKYYNRVKEKSLKFNLMIDSSDPSFMVDEDKLIRILGVLMDNAIKFTREGTISLKCESNEKVVKLIVSDTGDGIREDMQKRILEPFAQEDEGHKRNFEGAGLGLTIAQKLTKFMNGKFHLQSQKGVGTQVILTFPLSSN